MPFQSEKQRKYMHIHHPEIAQRWEDEAKQRGESPVQQGSGRNYGKRGN